MRRELLLEQLFRFGAGQAIHCAVRASGGRPPWGRGCQAAAGRQAALTIGRTPGVLRQRTTTPRGPSRRQRHLLLKKIDLSSPRWLPANDRPPPCPRSVPLLAMACLRPPPRDQAPRRGGSVGREGLSSGRSPLSAVADGAGALAHCSAEQADRPLAATKLPMPDPKSTKRSRRLTAVVISH